MCVSAPSSGGLCKLHCWTILSQFVCIALHGPRVAKVCIAFQRPVVAVRCIITLSGYFCSGVKQILRYSSSDSPVLFFYIYPWPDVFHFMNMCIPSNPCCIADAMLYWCDVTKMWLISVCSRPQKRRTTWQSKKSHFTVSTLAVEQHNNFIMTTTIYVATVNKSSGCLEHLRALLVYLSLPPTLPFPRPLALQKKYFESMLNTND